MTDIVARFKEQSYRDDCCEKMVPSDVREMLGEIERLRNMLDRVSHLNSFRELNDILPEVRAMLVKGGLSC